MVEIIPAILTNDPKELEEKLRLLEGKVKRVQIDIIDGVYVANHTVMPDVLSGIETDLLVDFHLMTKEPPLWVERCVTGQADRIIGHIEQMGNQSAFIEKVVEVGAKVGLAIDLETPVEAIDGSLLTSLDVVLVMSVPAGFGGQEFNSSVLEKIKKLKEIKSRDDTLFSICVDGGINERNIHQVVEAGADEVSIGRRLFEGSVEENIEMLVQASLSS